MQTYVRKQTSCLKLEDGYLLKQLANQQENADLENSSSSKETNPFGNTDIAELYKYIKTPLRIKREMEKVRLSIRGYGRSAEG